MSPPQTSWAAPISTLFVSAWIGACSEWPRHANIPEASKNTVAAGEAPSDAFEMDWIELTEEEPNDQPKVDHNFVPGDGWQLEGELSGVGWDPNDTDTSNGTCGEPLAFPPTYPGTYSGDIDWFSFTADKDATLCMGISLEDEQLAFDWSVFTLNDCGEPTEVFISSSTNAPVGLAQTGGYAHHVLHLRGGTTIGMALAGYWPDDPDHATHWTMQGALVPLVPNAEAAFCPPDLGVP